MSNDEPRDGYCNAETRDDGYCGRKVASPSDRCYMHGGATPTKDENPNVGKGSEDQDGNTRAVTHGAYADHNRYYQDILDDAHRQLVDDIFADYYTEYESRHGEPPLGLEAELFRLSVTHVKDVALDSWASDRPDQLAESGHSLIDSEKRYTENGSYTKYKESVVMKAQKRLSTDRRQWLKDLGLLEDPDSQLADNVGDLASIIADES